MDGFVAIQKFTDAGDIQAKSGKDTDFYRIMGSEFDDLSGDMVIVPLTDEKFERIELCTDYMRRKYSRCRVILSYSALLELQKKYNDKERVFL